MPLVSLDIPPGVYANGTDMQSSGRWLDASLVRWTDGTMRPVGGWEDKGVTSLGAAARGAISWVDNSGDRWVAVGTYDKLQVINAAGTLSDITPVGFTSGSEDAAASVGYGAGLYGTGFYGTPRISSTYSDATTWSLDTWGDYLVGCSTDDGKLYEWQLSTGTPAAAISGAPTGCTGLVVTPERFLFALGAGGNKRKVQWCDKEDNTAWTPSATNEAGDFILETSGEIMLGIAARGQTLILTDTDAWTASYIGPQLVYGFERAGGACGPVSRNAAAGANNAVYWMGNGSFHMFAGGAVEEIPCDVADEVFTNLNTAQRSKVYAVPNTRHSEIWWFYPVSTECDRYVSYNYLEGHWSIGTIDRCCGVDVGAFRTPTWFAPGGLTYSHEIGNNYGGAEVYAESGPISIGDGDRVTSVTYMYPDEETRGDVTATFQTRFFPNGDEYEYGPFNMNTPTSVRFTGRQLRMRVTGATLTDWRFGLPRLDIRAGSRR